MSRFIHTSTAMLLALTLLTPMASADDDTTPPTATWQMSLGPVPELLRIHFPMLPRDSVVLVHQVHPTGIAAEWGVQPGDLLLEVDRRPLQSAAQMPTTNQCRQMLILRRGRISVLNNPVLQAPAPRATTSAAVSAISFAGGNESVSVSQSGDQILIEMSIPEAFGPIRFRGTRQEIVTAVDSSDLSAAAKRKVLTTIGASQ